MSEKPKREEYNSFEEWLGSFYMGSSRKPDERDRWALQWAWNEGQRYGEKSVIDKLWKDIDESNLKAAAQNIQPFIKRETEEPT